MDLDRRGFFCCLGVSIGGAPRFPKAADANCSPGPIYKLPEAAPRLGPRRPLKKDYKALEARQPPAPAPSPTCGKPPKKPRFRMHLVHSLSGAKHGMWGQLLSLSFYPYNV